MIFVPKDQIYKIMAYYLHGHLRGEFLLVLGRSLDQAVVHRPLVGAGNAATLEVVTLERPATLSFQTHGNIKHSALCMVALVGYIQGVPKTVLRIH